MRANLLDVAMRLAAGETVTAEEAARLLVAAAGQDDLVQALGLDWPTRIRLRNAALVRAAHLLAAGDSLTAHQIAVRLLKAVERFEVLRWPRLRAGGWLADLEPLDLELARAFMAAEVPRTDRGLAALLAKNEPDVFAAVRAPSGHDEYQHRNQSGHRPSRCA